MIAIRSILDAGRFHCFSLMREKRSPWGCTTTEQTSSCNPLISSLFNIAGHLVEVCAEAIQEVLDALIGELSEEQQQFVAKALQNGILAQLKDR
ncbi:gasdermin-B [Urocitellus parryii]